MLLAAVRCWWRGRHEPVRQLGGGFRCFDCHAPGADLEELGFADSAYVSLEPRHTFSREPYELTRTSEFGDTR